ncbi:low molecular weight protein tyrosine phosphatase family protein [Erythrobacter ani]|uniref:Phosphotyrosine protein phosphatase n=1 Tax=Erythrobacter ani TaxID=2827235 RepID=A0ABS6SJ18_9SPHN|nr:phosphotyrosine protein phosphatase [Erythrobacter ani]MBV7264976.1 phosphotyrosine protein phosphatase [Erythrobacter ani]
MSDRHFLFVCGKNKLRSPTAENLFADVNGIATLSAGINRDSEEPLSDELIEWADIIFVMEHAHRKKVLGQFCAGLDGKRVVVLDIADDYDFMAPELVRLLRKRMRRWLPGDGP